MGNKVHPTSFRLGTTATWQSRWFSVREYPKFLRQDVEVRAFLRDLLREAAVDRIDIERSANQMTIIIASAKPGFIIGRAGAGAEEIKEKIRQKFFRGQKVSLGVNIVEVPRPSLSSSIVMQQIVSDLEKRMPFRRVLKMTVDRVSKAGARGVRVEVAGRLNGAEIARTEKLAWGSVPLHNLRADINYAQGFARTIYGTIGVKVWIYRGEVFEKEKE
ncbi:30S ribosomal protein S3 [Candidatus Uhrbacteria bacterium RIFCSPHIGHO2_12_FULL_57_11]|uniref:Small ribosomal subunit protein uS3 n=2 Tax=Candidatus Uhriibacteriota TaxID=1752732 RepID=A0A1F7UJV4_9BACT|nr:MAG: 30S ribosomal protein S3 [Candidatus Uhrbacteria bacterium RIFCSPHIGHO2_02_FULL_57_19]OGL78535.1 MAG: 30S ribosomal protein S3 [Candidatus Uhrbacteria bacterium RIFCSPHIGHO2_12_FULL_57_11]